MVISGGCCSGACLPGTPLPGGRRFGCVFSFAPQVFHSCVGRSPIYIGRALCELGEIKFARSCCCGRRTCVGCYCLRGLASCLRGGADNCSTVGSVCLC